MRSKTMRSKLNSPKLDYSSIQADIISASNFFRHNRAPRQFAQRIIALAHIPFADFPKDQLSTCSEVFSMLQVFDSLKNDNVRYAYSRIPIIQYAHYLFCQTHNSVLLEILIPEISTF